MSDPLLYPAIRHSHTTMMIKANAQIISCRNGAAVPALRACIAAMRFAGPAT